MLERNASVLFAVLLIAGSAVSARADSMEGTYRDGDLVVTLRVSHLGIRTSDRIAVILKAVAPAGEIIEMASYPDRLGDFRVRDARPGQMRLSQDRKTVERTNAWVLEPYLPGSYGIPAFVVSSRLRGVEDGGRRRVETPAVSVEVASVFPAADEKPPLRDAAGEMRDHTPWMPLVLLLILAPPAVAMILRIFRRGGQERRRVEGAKEEAADLVALAALEAMGEGGGDIEGSGPWVQDVLNGYLQGRFRQRTLGRSLEEVAKKLKLDGVARGIFERLVEQLQRARYGRTENAAVAAASARLLLKDFVRETTGNPETS